MSLATLLTPNGKNGFGASSTAEQVTDGYDLSGKTFLVTGCNSGLGLETARVLSMRGATVVGAARTEEKAREALAPLGKANIPVACELSEPASVRAAVAAVAERAPRLDGLIANAGIMALPERQLKYGYELQFFTNHVGHFMLVTGLLSQLTPSARVVILSSSAHQRTYPEGIRFDDLAAERGYTAWGAYGQSKLANMLFARELAKRVPAGQTVNAVHPGVIATNLSRHMSSIVQVTFSTLGNLLFLKDAPQGAATQCFVAVNEGAATITGEYWADCNVAACSRHGTDMAMAAALWTKTEEIVAAL